LTNVYNDVIIYEVGIDPPILPSGDYSSSLQRGFLKNELEDNLNWKLK